MGQRLIDGNDIKPVFRCDDFEAMRLAARSGMGIALLPDWVVGPDVNAGALTRIRFLSETWNTHCDGIWLLRALAQPSARLRVVIAALRTTIGIIPTWESRKVRA